MQPFDCLDSCTDIDGFHLLEASAGTGKTFAIEHLFARFCQKVDIDQILVVTFTKAATAELKARIYQNLQTALHEENTSFDYMREIQQNKERLKEAFINFDDAQIFTIHGFCQRMLQENFLQANVFFSQDFSKDKVIKALLKFFKENLSTLGLLPFQLELLIKHFKGIKGLLEKLLLTFSQEEPQHESQNFSEAFVKKLSLAPISFDKKSVYETCHSAFSCYKRTGYNLDALEKELQVLLTLVEKKNCSEKESSFFLKSKGALLNFFSIQNLKVRSEPIDEPIITWAQEYLLPLIDDALSISKLFSLLRRNVQGFLKALFEKEGFFSPDRILEKMQEACQKDEFVKKISSKYKVLIIDEFQDTDPVQWNIFKTLFLNNKELLAVYLVGDPKQSIYRFRKADLYTYLQAEQVVGKNSVYHLTDNFRSQKNLITSLNAFFDHTFAKKWLALPKLNTFLDYHPVSAKKEEKPLIDHLAPLHFFVAEEKGKKTFPSKETEEKKLLPFIYEEIVRLKEEGFLGKDFAILVKDRFQAKRVSDFLQGKNISCVSKSVIDIRNSPIFLALKELFEAVVFFPDPLFLKKALLGKFFSLPFALVEQIEQTPFYSSMIQTLSSLKEILEEKGIPYFFQKLLQTDFLQDGRTILDALSLLDKAYVFDLRQLIEIFLERASGQKVFLETIFTLFNEIENLPIEEHELLKRRGVTDEDALQIMTIHMSKGLEFGVVFALGLASRVNPDQFLSEEERLELDAEKMRQLYVALTRAKNRVYVPYVIDLKPKALKTGQQSALELFFQNALGKKALEKQDLITGLAKLSDAISINFLEEKILEEQETKAPFSYIFDNQPLPKSSNKILSFSSISSHLDRRESFIQAEAIKESLPGGAKTGIILHALLEKVVIDPLLQEEEALFAFLQKKLFLSHLKGFEEKVFQIINKTINFSIFENFGLKDLDNNHMQVEMEVFYPLENRGLMQGIIDLAFFHQGKYYLVDWKSNLLPCYSHQFLEEEVQKHEYDLQASIYTEAFRRYLENIEKASFKDAFGGYYLIFLRGLVSDQGIYKLLPSQLKTNERINAILSSRK